MKTILQHELYGPNGPEEILDQDTYCYFRDEIFIKEIKEFIQKKSPKEWEKAHSPHPMFEEDEVAQNVHTFYEIKDLMCKYYPKYDKRRPKFHLYKNEIYFFKFYGYRDIAFDIELKKLEINDLAELLNGPIDSPLKDIFRLIRSRRRVTMEDPNLLMILLLAFYFGNGAIPVYLNIGRIAYILLMLAVPVFCAWLYERTHRE